jgi:hypothetical protein
MAAILGVLKGDEDEVAPLRPPFPEPAAAAVDADTD